MSIRIEMLIRSSREGSDLVDNVWKNCETIRETEGPCPWPDLKTSIRLLTEHLAIFPSFLEWHWQAVSVTLEFNLQIIAISPKPTQQHLTACSNRLWKGTKRQTISLPLGWGCSQPYVVWGLCLWVSVCFIGPQCRVIRPQKGELETSWREGGQVMRISWSQRPRNQIQICQSNPHK